MVRPLDVAVADELLVGGDGEDEAGLGEARARGAVKLTLEVLSGNRAAQALYASRGFAGYTLDPAAGHALFWQKALA